MKKYKCLLFVICFPPIGPHYQQGAFLVRPRQTESFLVLELVLEERLTLILKDPTVLFCFLKLLLLLTNT